MAYNAFSEIPTNVNPAELFPYQTQGTSGCGGANKDYTSNARYFTSHGKSYANLQQTVTFTHLSKGKKF